MSVCVNAARVHFTEAECNSLLKGTVFQKCLQIPNAFVANQIRRVI